jgi:small subunit ribosomal protein S6
MGEVILPQSKSERSYETVYIVRANLDEDAVDRTVAGVEEYLKGLGATIESTEKKGRRRLAYEVDKMRDGYYVVTVFKAKSEAIAQIKRMMSLSEDIIRSLIVLQEKSGSTIG